MKIKLNLGCGTEKLLDFIGIDIDPGVKPDRVHDIKTGLPYGSGEVDEICFFHTIEHIEKKYHFIIFREISRVLKIGGKLYISYPEFKKCAQNYMDNKSGANTQAFWEATIYGRQGTPSDYHVALMDSTFFLPILRDLGFSCNMTYELAQPHNTMVEAIKLRNIVLDEDILRKEVCNA